MKHHTVNKAHFTNPPRDGLPGPRVEHAKRTAALPVPQERGPNYKREWGPEKPAPQAVVSRGPAVPLPDLLAAGKTSAERNATAASAALQANREYVMGQDPFTGRFVPTNNPSDLRNRKERR